jgi:inner membrane protein
MPSPLGHALGGLAVGWLVAGRRGTGPLIRHPRVAGRRWWQGRIVRQGALFAALGMLADVDFLFGTHNTYTHSIGAALIVGLAAGVLASGRRLSGGLTAGAAYGSHLLLDWLGDDRSPPIGIMALWPFSGDFYQSPVPIFMGISRRYWRDDFLTHNALAVVREIATLGPVLVLVWWTRLRRPSKSEPGRPRAKLP